MELHVTDNGQIEAGSYTPDLQTIILVATAMAEVRAMTKDRDNLRGDFGHQQSR